MSDGEQASPGSRRAATSRSGGQDDPGHSGFHSDRNSPPPVDRGALAPAAASHVIDSERHHDDSPKAAAAHRAGGRRIPARKDRGRRGSFLRELPALVLVAFVLALLIKAFLVQAFWIPSESMERTLLVEDRVLVNKVVYRFRDVHRGEVVVFNGEGTDFESKFYVEAPGNVAERVLRGVQGLLGLGAPSEKDFIKRVIGVGGDTVVCCDAQGRVTVNGAPLDEPYVFENNDLEQRRFGPVVVPDGHLWLMGDHRRDSSDSRSHGTVPEDKVVGRAFVKVWPLSRVGLLGVPEGTFRGVPGPSAAAAVGPPVVLAGIGLLAVPIAMVRRSRAVALRCRVVVPRSRASEPRYPGSRHNPRNGEGPGGSAQAGRPRTAGHRSRRRRPVRRRW